METQSNTSKGKYWMLFIISLVVMIALLIFIHEWSWVALPFVLTYLVYAMDVV